MTITNIISAIGNNRSIYPLLVRDCAIEVPSKIYITRKENLKESKEIANDATREKFIDEYATSAIWLGGIPAVEYFADKFIKKNGYNPKVNLKLFNETKYQGINVNLKKFKNLVPNEVLQDLEKVKNNKKIYELLLAKKFIAATAIPILVMGFILPKANFALTRKIREKKIQQRQDKANQANVAFLQRYNKNVPFTGGITSAIANLKTVDKMAVTDGGLTVGRVTTSRNKNEGYVNAFRMLGSMFFNFVTPAYIAAGLDKSMGKLFKINVDLDPLFLENEEFLIQIKENKLDLPKKNTEKELLEFLDQKPNSVFSKFVQKADLVSYLDNDIRDPRKYVDIKQLAKLKNRLADFAKMAVKSKNVENFVKKAKYIKNFNILANVGISSFLLAGLLPKMQYGFNKLVTGSYLDPGLNDKNNVKK